jgi:hypothetical protein
LPQAVDTVHFSHSFARDEVDPVNMREPLTARVEPVNSSKRFDLIAEGNFGELDETLSHVRGVCHRPNEIR